MSGRALGLALVCLTMLTGTGAAQQSCQVVRRVGAALQVRCGEILMLAITDAMQRASLDSLVELEGARRTLALKDSIISTHERERALYDTTLARKNAYIAELEQLSDGYRRLAGGYKKLSAETNLTLEGGLGSTGSSEPAILAGIGFRRLRIWGFFQRDNAGGIIGVNFPLF